MVNKVRIIHALREAAKLIDAKAGGIRQGFSERNFAENELRALARKLEAQDEHKSDWIVAVTSKVEDFDEHEDEYFAFRYSDYGAETKAKAQEMYERVRVEADTYSATLAEIVESTDYFGGK